MDDSASQEIEASTSSQSSPNSKKQHFVHSILKIAGTTVLYNHGSQGIDVKDRVPRLPLLEKKDFIENWVKVHSHPENLPEIPCPDSPELGLSITKRAAGSPILGYKKKRSRRDIGLKEKSRVSLIEKLQFSSPKKSASSLENIENAYEKSPVLGSYGRSNETYDRTLNYSPILNMTNMSYSTCWDRAKTSPKKEAEMQRRQELKYPDRRSLVRDCTMKPETLSLSSPLCTRERLEIETNDSEQESESSKNRVSHGLSWLKVKKRLMNLEAVSSAKQSPLESLENSNVLPLFESERIDAESSIANALEDDVKIETGSDVTLSDLIENAETQNLAALIRKNTAIKIEDASGKFGKVDKESSEDSDETYFSNGDPVVEVLPNVPFSPKYSQKISQSTSNCARVSASKSDILISQVTSPMKNHLTPIPHVPLMNTTEINNKKKKKAKKGSVLERLQAIVSLQTSSLRIWRYQMSHIDLKKSSTQFVTLKIRQRETRYGRHYLVASVIEDSHNLLKDLPGSESTSELQSIDSFVENKMVMLMIVPDITGIVKIRAESALRIYPPWEIMDHVRKILNVIYFSVIDDGDTIKVHRSETERIRTNVKVIQEFDCPCIQAKQIVDHCRVKFSTIKPNVMKTIFESRN